MAVYCRRLRFTLVGSPRVSRSQHGSQSISRISLFVGSAGQDVNTLRSCFAPVAIASAAFVIASGVLHTVMDFVAAAFARPGLPWEPYMVEDTALLHAVQRPVPLCGDATLLREATGWRPGIGVTEMVGRMVAAELHSREISDK